MKKSKLVIIISLIISIICLFGFIPSGFFLLLLLLQHGKLYYVILFSLIALVFLLGFLLFLFISVLAINNNKNFAFLEKNGIKVNNEVKEDIAEEKNEKVEEEIEKENVVETNVVETNIVLTPVEEKEETNDISEDEVKHETIYKVVNNSEDSFSNYLSSNRQIDETVQEYFTKKVESNQKKREQSIKNEEALSHIKRTINYNECIMNDKFLKYNELTLNMDYIEEVKVNDNELNFIIFDIKYTLIFDDNNKVLAFLSYLKSNNDI